MYKHFASLCALSNTSIRLGLWGLGAHGNRTLSLNSSEWMEIELAPLNRNGFTQEIFSLTCTGSELAFHKLTLLTCTIIIRGLSEVKNNKIVAQ